MTQEIIHTIGSVAYFVFLLLFLWVRHAFSGARGMGWWALAMGFALAARLMLVALFMHSASTFFPALYALLVMLEKFCLLVGLVRFLNLPQSLGLLYGAVALAECWVIGCSLFSVSAFVRGFGIGLFNAGFLLYAAWLAFTYRERADKTLMLVFIAASIGLALHWASAFPIIRYAPSWSQNGFLLGTTLVLVQYFCLLAMALSRVHQALLDAKTQALDMALNDPLTGLSNLRGMGALFETALVLANRPHQSAAVLFIDMDNFKPINDQAGHRVGDEVLRSVAARLRDAMRSTDICARLGGDEFVVVCTQLEQPDQALAIANKLRETLIHPYEVGGQSYTLGASIGVSLYPAHGQTLQELLELADKAMYQVKSAGRNACVLHGATAE